LSERVKKEARERERTNDGKKIVERAGFFCRIQTKLLERTDG